MFSVFGLIRSGEYLQAIISILTSCFVVFICLPIHELAHGWVANLLGDHTAKNQGRLTFNPIAHLNPIGTIMIFLFGIGYANPVPVNPNNFKNPKAGMAITSLAGPVSNLLMAFVSSFVYYALPVADSGILYAVKYFFYLSAYINVTLAAFNILPIPPLDGSKVVAALLPDRAYEKYMRVEQYAMIILMVLLFTGVFNSVIGWLSSKLFVVVSIIPYMIFGG